MTLDKTDKDIVHTKGKATHKAKQEDWVLYDVAEKERAKFFPWAVPTPMCMCDATAMTILVHLQKNATEKFRD